MTRRSVTRQGNWRIFRWPLVMAVASTIGLVAALVGNGGWDIVSCVTLGGTLMVIVPAWRGWSAR